MKSSGSMEAPAVRLQKVRPSVAMVEIDAPPSNALGRALRRQFLSHLDALEHDVSVRALIVTGQGTSFCSGDDLKEREAAMRAGGEDSASNFVTVIDRIESLRMPVIAAVNGWAIGGGLELALACDIRIASQDAQFVCAAVNVGLIASAYRLPRLIGIARAKHMLLTGLPVRADAAELFGLVTETHALEALRDGAVALAERIATRAPLSVEATKRVAGKALDLDRGEAADAMRKEFELLVKSRDHAEALAAFQEKRTPEFRRR